MNVLLFAPEYRPNLSSMVRSAEFFGLKEVFIYDKNELLAPPKNKKSRADMNHLARVWTAGAVDHITITKVEEPTQFLQNYQGRKIATLVNTSAEHISNFKFQKNDLLIFGSEKDGLPEEMIPFIDHGVYIPAKGKTDCLNVAVTFGLVLHWALESL